MNNLFRWKQGRQASGYDKLLIATLPWPIPFDLYLLKLPDGCFVPDHKDSVKPGFRHYRMNLILWKSKSGGELISEKTIINWSRLQFFRPDIYTHSATKVKGGSVWILSFGFLLKSTNKPVDV